MKVLSRSCLGERAREGPVKILSRGLGKVQSRPCLGEGGKFSLLGCPPSISFSLPPLPFPLPGLVWSGEEGVLNLCLHSLSPSCNQSLRITSAATRADLWTVSMVTNRVFVFFF